MKDRAAGLASSLTGGRLGSSYNPRKARHRSDLDDINDEDGDIEMGEGTAGGNNNDDTISPLHADVKTVVHSKANYKNLSTHDEIDVHISSVDYQEDATEAAP